MEITVCARHPGYSLWIRFFLVMLVMSLLAYAPSAWGEEVKVAGGQKTRRLVLEPLKVPFEKATGMTMTIHALDSVSSFQQLRSGKLDMFATTLEMGDVFQEIVNKGGDISDRGSFQVAVVTRIPLSVAVHNSNPVKSLTREQLRGIFNGTIRSWYEIGGEDVPIRVIFNDAPLDSALQYQMMDGDPLYEEAENMVMADALKAVAQSPEAIAVFHSAMIDGSVKVVSTPAIVQVVNFVTRGEPSRAVQELIEFARGEGQKYLKIFPTP